MLGDILLTIIKIRQNRSPDPLDRGHERGIMKDFKVGEKVRSNARFTAKLFSMKPIRGIIKDVVPRSDSSNDLIRVRCLNGVIKSVDEAWLEYDCGHCGCHHSHCHCCCGHSEPVFDWAKVKKMVSDAVDSVCGKSKKCKTCGK